ncbi:MAG: Hpt domain-containing protein [Treponema sp.]|jgi:HPt (histidine-containing phosphotransfer) domain-containing protein|nr:Hpt domain-containing protein [Treponema sp.]
MADDVVYINTDEGSKRVMNNTKLYAKLLVKFKDDPSMTQVETAFAEGDTESARGSVHTLKGLAANLSLIELFNQSLELETQIKTNSINPDQLDILKDVYDKTIEEMEKVIAQYA